MYNYDGSFIFNFMDNLNVTSSRWARLRIKEENFQLRLLLACVEIPLKVSGTYKISETEEKITAKFKYFNAKFSKFRQR